LTRVNAQIIVLAAVEFVLAVAAVQFAAFVRFSGHLPAEIEGWRLWVRAAVFGAAVIVGLTAMGLYQVRQRLKVEAVLIRMLVGLGFAAVGLTLVYYAIPDLGLGRGWWALSFTFTLLLLVGSRAVSARLVDQDIFRRRVLVFGAGKRAASLLQLRRRSDRRGFQIVAFVPVPDEPRAIQDERVDPSPGTLAELARTHDAEEIVIAMDERRRNFPIKELLDCKFAGVDVIDVVAFLERESGKVKIDLMDPSWLIFSEGFTRRSSRMVMFRLFDLVVSLIAVAIGWPVFVLTALAILIDDGRPVFYRQTRVGLLGKEFELLKFRSMTKNAEQNGEAQWAQRNDDRVTKVGAWIRKLRFDELPQLWNVIKGDMRLVGPRPERTEFVKALSQKIPYYHERHCVKPGLTGWAQLSYPYGSSERDALEKLQFDLYYVKNQSLIFDLMILLQTVEVVIWGKGAR
jgi:sugar transferase (PEP-CTERM system associated)